MVHCSRVRFIQMFAPRAYYNARQVVIFLTVVSDGILYYTHVLWTFIYAMNDGNDESNDAVQRY